MFTIFILGLSVSIDSWAVGASYQGSGIRIPFRTKLVVAGISAVAALAALLLGEGLAVYINPRWLQIAGGGLLMFLGAKMLWETYIKKKERNFDTDASQSIDVWEGLVLGSVLASDSLCAGLSLCGMGQLAYGFPVIVGVLTIGFLWLGEKGARVIAAGDFLAGFFLIAIGVMQAVGF